MRLVTLMAISTVLSACSIADEVGLAAKNPIEEAKNLSAMAEKCLLDVRDKHQKYEFSKHCQDLGSISQVYINAGGQLPDEPFQAKLVGEQAVRMAWTARAISASGDPSISVW